MSCHRKVSLHPENLHLGKRYRITYRPNNCEDESYVIGEFVELFVSKKKHLAVRLRVSEDEPDKGVPWRWVKGISELVRSYDSDDQSLGKRHNMEDDDEQ